MINEIDENNFQVIFPDGSCCFVKTKAEGINLLKEFKESY